MTTPRPGQLQAQISGAFDAVLARNPQRAAEVRRRAEFEKVWARLGYPDDPALKARTFAQLAPSFALWDARDDLARTLAATASKERLEAVRALGRIQGRALVLREHGQALTAALDRRALIAALGERIEVARRHALRPQGPIRLF